MARVASGASWWCAYTGVGGADLSGEWWGHVPLHGRAVCCVPVPGSVSFRGVVSQWCSGGECVGVRGEHGAGEAS